MSLSKHSINSSVQLAHVVETVKAPLMAADVECADLSDDPVITDTGLIMSQSASAPDLSPCLSFVQRFLVFALAGASRVARRLAFPPAAARQSGALPSAH